MKELLLGNEAIARGAVESGIQVYAAYPGTPSSELTDTMSRRARKLGFYMEYSTNEKVAMEVAAGAAIAGVRSMTAMKHVGLNVAADPFMSTVYVGVRAGMVVVSADDPNCRSSQNEQDNRRYARLANVPMVEPSDPDEAHKLVKRAFEVSEKFGTPVLMRTTTRVNHMRAPVEVGEIPDPYPRVSVEFKKDPFNLVPIPSVARKLHKRLLERIVRIREFFETVPRNRREGSGSLGIVASGAAYNYASDVVRDMELDAEILKLTTTRPIPRRLVGEFLESHDEVLVVEEVDPFLETQLRAIAQELGINVKIYGKGLLPDENSVLPSNGELRPEIVAKALERITGKRSPYEEREELDVVPRPPVMCPGCPHRATYYAARRVFGTKAIASSDIGCYTLGIMPPFYYADTLLCMGSSVGMAGGLRRATGGYVLAFIGDSTFFHAGMPGLANLVYNKHKAVVVIMDNRTTAMTGHQPHPGVGVTGTGEQTRPLMPEDIAKAMGIEFIRVVDPHDIAETTKAFREAKKYLDERDHGVAVIITRAPCALLEVREKRMRGEEIIPYRIDPEKCIDCGLCYKYFNCPAIIKDGDKPRILPELCVGCGDCARICPKNAIEPARRIARIFKSDDPLLKFHEPGSYARRDVHTARFTRRATQGGHDGERGREAHVYRASRLARGHPRGHIKSRDRPKHPGRRGRPIPRVRRIPRDAPAPDPRVRDPRVLYFPYGIPRARDPRRLSRDRLDGRDTDKNREASSRFLPPYRPLLGIGHDNPDLREALANPVR